MIFSRPSLKDLSIRISSDLGIHLGIPLPLEKRSVLFALSQVLAGSSYLLHGHLEALTQSLFPDSAQGEALESWAARTGVKRRQPSKARGFVKFISDKNGILIPKGKRLSRDDSVFYIIQAAGQIKDGVSILEVEAEESGGKSNSRESTVLTLTESIAGVKPQATVEPLGIREGFDLETDRSFRERILLSLSSPGSCGSETDFILWAMEIVGVARVFLSPNYLGVPSVGISFLVDDLSSPLPSRSKIEEVEAHLRSKCPVGFGLTVFHLKANPIRIELELSDFSAEEKPKIAEILEKDFKQFFFNQSKPHGILGVPQLIQQIEKSLRGRAFVLKSPHAPLINTLETIATFGGLKCT